MKLGDFLKAINVSKENLLADDEAGMVENEYPPFLINRILSYYPDCIVHAAEMNRYPALDRRMQFEYYLHAIRKRSRFSPWQKREDPKELALVKEWFGYSSRQARAVLPLLSDADLKMIKAKIDSKESK